MTIARNPRCMRACGVSAPTAVSSQPASAAATRLMPHPANIEPTASAPDRRRVGKYPTAQSAATTATARPRKRAYRLLPVTRSISVLAGLLQVPLAGILGALVSGLRLARGLKRFLHEVVEPAD